MQRRKNVHVVTSPTIASPTMPSVRERGNTSHTTTPHRNPVVGILMPSATASDQAMFLLKSSSTALMIFTAVAAVNTPRANQPELP